MIFLCSADVSYATTGRQLVRNCRQDACATLTHSASYHPAHWDTPGKDSFWQTPYVYHTFGMEWFPGEVRFLLDSNVVHRYPDRTVPRGTTYPSNIYYEYARRIPRTPVRLLPGDFFMDSDDEAEPMGIDSSINYINRYVSSIDTTVNPHDTSYWYDTVYRHITYNQRHYFEIHPDCSGCDTVTIGSKSYPAAHHKLDYVRIWDVPPYIKLPDYEY